MTAAVPGRGLSVLPPDALHAAVLSPDDVQAQQAAADTKLANTQVRLLQQAGRAGCRLRGANRMPVRDRLVEYFELLRPDDRGVPQPAGS